MSNQGTWPRPNSEGDPDKLEELRQLYVELDSIEIAIIESLTIVERNALVEKRAEVLGKIKRMERDREAMEFHRGDTSACD